MAAALAGGAASASADVQQFDQYVLDFTNTPFATLSGAFGSGNTVGFHFSIAAAANVLNIGAGTVSATFALPSFTVTARPNYILTGEITGSFGRFSYSEAPGASTTATVSGTSSIDGVVVANYLDTPLTRFAITANNGEYGAVSATVGQGPFNEFKFTGGALTLTATNGAIPFSNVSPQASTELRISFTALPVPEPESYAMLLAGLCLLGVIVRRRTRDDA
ncbi:MAG: PEP-CTERM sorting domain-containing protein [Burkholderiales bacterium]|nr:PEP-CTERM sorting domain-containing protein [Burkholderiales bacterium]